MASIPVLGSGWLPVAGGWSDKQQMTNLLQKVQRRVARMRERRRERLEIAPLYSPDPDDLDLQRHLSEAIEWQKRAQDAGNDRGISYGVRFGDDFDVSYPETTGYICQTFVELGALYNDQELIDRAVAMGDWEIDIQLPEGAVMGGKYNTDPTPAVFNTGMVLLGWSALIRHTGEDRFAAAARRASDWLIEVQEEDGNWVGGNSQFAKSGASLYNVKAAWGLCEAGAALDNDAYIQGAIRNAEYCIAQQYDNGWFPNCCIYDPENPLLHTIAYTMQGLIGIGKLTGRQDFIDAARKTADVQASIMDDSGFLPARQNSRFIGTDNSCCLTGAAQTSIVWNELYLLTGESKYRDLAKRVNLYLLKHHDIQNADDRIRGGLAGSWPVTAKYGHLKILNWATKFLIDALAFQQRNESNAGS